MTAASPDRRAIITEALRKIDDLSARLEIAEKADTEPIAVVGMGCRLPGGVNNADEFWELLQDGASGIVRVPADRWDADAFYSDDHTVPGTICNREGGFLTSWQPDEFDAEFFGIAPREAAAMDPQQRLLLEVAWEALENAGINPRTIRGTQTAVFVGLTTNDYYHSRSRASCGRRTSTPTSRSGMRRTSPRAGCRTSSACAAPRWSVDTACSSSLVSMHLACQSLRRRESDTALAAGVNLILSPENSIACSRWGMLCPGRPCKTFDADADGYVRSEGCGVVVLKRLTDALRDGDRVLAVVRGSAVNQDGASSGQTVPNGPAQQALMRQALAASRLAPSDIDYIEAHGTGTALGDPIELDALSAGLFATATAPRRWCWVRSRPTSAIWNRRPASPDSSRPCSACTTATSPSISTSSSLTPHASEGASRFTIASEPMEWPAVATCAARGGVVVRRQRHERACGARAGSGCGSCCGAAGSGGEHVGGLG